MADYTQTQLTLLAQQQIVHPANVIGTPVTVATGLQGIAYVWLGNYETTANATAPSIFIQASPDASGNTFVTLAELLGSTTASEAENLSDATGEPVGETVMTVASTTNLVVGDLILITDALGGVAENEFHQIVAVVANTSVTIMDGLAYGKAQNDTIYDQALTWAVPIDLSGIQRLRACVVHQAATGSNLVVKALFEYASDIE